MQAGLCNGCGALVPNTWSGSPITVGGDVYCGQVCYEAARRPSVADQVRDMWLHVEWLYGRAEYLADQGMAYQAQQYDNAIDAEIAAIEDVQRPFTMKQPLMEIVDDVREGWQHV